MRSGTILNPYEASRVPSAYSSHMVVVRRGLAVQGETFMSSSEKVALVIVWSFLIKHEAVISVLSLRPLATSDWEIPLDSSRLCRSLSLRVILPVTRVDPWPFDGKREGREEGRKDGWAHTTEMSQKGGFPLHHFGAISKCSTFPGICGRAEKHSMDDRR